MFYQFNTQQTRKILSGACAWCIFLRTIIIRNKKKPKTVTPIRNHCGPMPDRCPHCNFSAPGRDWCVFFFFCICAAQFNLGAHPVLVCFSRKRWGFTKVAQTQQTDGGSCWTDAPIRMHVIMLHELSISFFMKKYWFNSVKIHVLQSKSQLFH